MQEMWVWSLGQEDPLEKEMASHSGILVWEIPWTEEPGGLQSMGLQKELDMTEWLNHNDSDKSCLNRARPSSLRLWTEKPRAGETQRWQMMLGGLPSQTRGSTQAQGETNLEGVQFSSVHSLSRVWLFVTPWTQILKFKINF